MNIEQPRVKKMVRVLVVEKEGRTRAVLQCQLNSSAKVKSAACIEAALEKLVNHKYDLILWNTSSDRLTSANFNDSLNRLSQRAQGTRTIVLTHPEENASPVPCSNNFYLKPQPHNDEELLALVENHLPLTDNAEPSRSMVAEFDLPMEFEGIITVSLPMRAVIRRIMEAATVDIPVLITGETGTGKDLIAAAIHKRSQRKDQPYIPVNTGAMAPELIASEIFGHERGSFTGAQEARAGIFEQADGGTVFLDEIATMDEKTQVSLLRVLEEKAFRRVGGIKKIGADVRIIAATNENLEQNVAEKRFREDLFYRLNVFHISVPPLRDRPGAITVLTDHFLSHFSTVYGKEVERVSAETYRLLRRYPWPGNVRELKNVIQTALLMVEGKELKPEFIPERIRNAVASSEERDEPTCSFRVGTPLDAVERELIRITLIHASGNKKLAASILGISRRALYNKIKKHKLP
jgi:two-component system, NtrC family, response regulator AtoC